MTHQRNVVLQAAIAAAFGLGSMSAHAVPPSASAIATVIATAAIVDNTTTVVGSALTYSTGSPLGNIAPQYVIYVKLSAGSFSSTTPPLPATFTAPGNVPLQTALQAGTIAVSTDGTFFTLSFVSPAVEPVGTVIVYTPGVTDISGLASLVSGGSVFESMSIGSSASKSTVLSDVDGPPAGGNIITFAAAQTFAVSSSAGFTSGSTTFTNGVNESAVINVSGGTGVALALTPGGLTNTTLANGVVDLGAFKFTDVPGVKAADNVTLWTMANIYTTATGALSATLTGQFAATTTVFLATDHACTAGIQAFTLNTAKTIATLSGGSASPTTVSQFVCMDVDGKTTIPATAPTLVVSLKPLPSGIGSTLTFPATGASTLYSLQPNGGRAIVRTYIPAGVTGYGDNVRIINTGLVAAAISVATIDPVTGAIGTPGVLTATPLAAGGAILFSSSQIEAAIGAIAPATRPRLLFTANTSIEAQNYIVNPNGTVTTLHGTE